MEFFNSDKSIIIDNLPVGYYQTDAAGIILYVNNYMAKLFDFDNIQELLSLNIRDILQTPIEREQNLTPEPSNSPVRDIYKLFTRKGKKITVRDTYRRFTNNNGKLIIEGSIEEIIRTEIPENIEENKVEELVERFVSFYRNTDDILFLHDFDGKMIEANPAAHRLLGYSAKEFKNLTFEDLLLKDDLFRAFNITNQIRISGFQNGHSEFSIKKKDGSRVWVETFSTAIYSNGKPYAVQGIARDISKRKEIEFLNHKIKDDFFDTFNKISNPAIIVKETKIVFTNDKFSELLGYENDKFIGNEIFDFVCSDCFDNLAANIYESYKHGSGNLVDCGFISASGKDVNVSASVKIINYNDSKALLFLFSNINEPNFFFNNNRNILNDFINSIKSEIVVIDSNKNIVTANCNYHNFLSDFNINIENSSNKNNIIDIYNRLTINNNENIDVQINNEIESLLNESKSSSSLTFSIIKQNLKKDYSINLNLIKGIYNFVLITQCELNCEISSEKSKNIRELRNFAPEKSYHLLLDDNSIITAISNDTANFLKNIFRQDFIVGNDIGNYFDSLNAEIFKNNFNLSLDGKICDFEIQINEPENKNSNNLQITLIPLNDYHVTSKNVLVVFSSTEKSHIKSELDLQFIELKQIKRAVEQSANSILISDNQGIITYVNSTYEKVTGYSRQELIGKNANVMNSGFHNKEFFWDLWETISKGSVWHGELLNAKKNGELFWEYASISPVFDSDGNIISYISIKDDITLRKEIELKVEENEEKLQAMLNAVPDLMFIIDKKGIFIDAYIPNSDIFVFKKPSEFINQSIFDILEKNTADLTYENLQRVIHNNERRIFLYDFKTDDKIRYYEARMAKCGKDKALAIVRDISKFKEDEILIKKQQLIKSVLTKWAGEFVNVPLELVDAKINDSLRDVGNALDVDRVYLFSYDFDNKLAINTHEWCNIGISPEIDNLRAVRLESMNNWVELHTAGKTIIIDNVQELPEDNPERMILEPQGIKTVMSIPVINNSRCIGFVGFDVCRNYKKWIEEEILVLKFLAELIFNLFERIENEKHKVTTKFAIDKHIKTKEILSKWAGEFINVSFDKYDEAINSTLEEIGNALDVDRIYIFSYDFNTQIATNTHEWCRDGIEPQINVFPYVPFDNMSNWIEIHKRGELVLIPDVSAMSDEDPLKYYLEPQKTTSALGIPIFNKGECLGFVGFDAVSREKVWEEDEILILKFLADILYNLQDKIKRHHEMLTAKLKAEEGDKLKSAFLANMSHEIRTPMNGILGFAKLLDVEDLKDVERNEYINIIKASSNRLMELINNILDISKLESGMIEVYYSQVDVSKLLNEVYNFYEIHALKKKIRIILDNDNSENSFYVITDHSKLFQILSYILDNALKFTLEGTISIGCKTEDKHLEVYVSDTGIGISDEFKPFLFERFRQENINLNRHHEGSGLGLAIVKGLCDLIGAEAIIESQKNVGTTVRILLPFKNISLTNLTKMRPEPVMIMNWKESVILIAEDDEINYKYIDKLLTRISGITTVRARNGKEAVDIAINNEEISLVLMDVKMPILDGHTATKQIKEKKPDMPIIAVTAFAMVQDRNAALKAGCDDYISKPFEADDILKVINKFLATD